MRVTPLMLAVAIFIGSTVPLLTSPAAADPSPTGYTPKLLWTPERQAIWNRMKSDYEKGSDTLGGRWYKLVKDNAECGCRYNDTGLWATFMYQWTGDRRYVDLAWKRLTNFISLPASKTGGNYIREYGIEYVVILDWLWPGLTTDRRMQMSGAIAAMLDNALNGNRFLNGYPKDDSDQVVGTYFAIAMFHLIQPNLARPTFTHPQTGGLDATAANRDTARNSVRHYVEMAAGGEWIESAAYNIGTVNLLLMGAEGVRTATKVDHFPEITRWIPMWGQRQLAFWTPDLSTVYQWGDEEHPRENRLYTWTNASGLAAGLLQGTTVGAQLQQQLLDLVAKYGSAGHLSMEPIVTGRLFFTFNPYAATNEWRGNSVFQAGGVGLVLHRRGIDGDGSLFAAHLATRQGRSVVHHFVRYFNDFELWRKGEWVITHPRGYGGAPNTGTGTNAVLMHGFGDMLEFKELLGVSSSETHDYQVGTTGGAAVPTPYFDPPPVFVHEWTRGVLYLPGSTDTIIVHDRAHVTDVARRERYSAANQALFDKAPSAKQWILHMPVRPTIEPSRISWSTPGGQRIQWSPLLPVASVKTEYDEKALQKGGEPAWKSAVRDAELKYHVKVWPASKSAWDTFLNVIQVGDAGAVAVVKGTDQTEGVHVSRVNQSDVIVMFNAQPSSPLEPAAYHPSHDQALRTARLRSSGYSVKWTSAADSTDIFLADLDPTKRWVVQVDGRVLIPVIPGSTALLRFIVDAPGTHTLTVHAADGAPAPAFAPPAAPAAPRGLGIIR